MSEGLICSQSGFSCYSMSQKKIIAEVRGEKAGCSSHHSTLMSLSNAYEDCRGPNTSGPCPCLWELLVLGVSSQSQCSMKDIIETQKAGTSSNRGSLKLSKHSQAEKFDGAS